MSKAPVSVAFSPPPEMREALLEPLRGVADVTYLPDLKEQDRAEALSSADVVVGWDIAQELRSPEEFALLKSASLIQLLSAGVDHIPFDRIPEVFRWLPMRRLSTGSGHLMAWMPSSPVPTSW